jgi:hypothetical protein
MAAATGSRPPGPAQQRQWDLHCLASDTLHRMMAGPCPDEAAEIWEDRIPANGVSRLLCPDRECGTRHRKDSQHGDKHESTVNTGAGA